MFIDLNIPFPEPIAYESLLPPSKKSSKQQKKQASTPLTNAQASTSTSAGSGSSGTAPAHPLERLRVPDRKALRERVEMLIHLGYTIIAFTQTVRSKLDPSTHVNWFAGGEGTVFKDLDPRFNGGKRGVVQLRRLEVVLDEASEKGFGFEYDILSLLPLTPQTFQSACLQHSLPSPHPVHIISLPLTASPRLPYYLKHTLVKTAIRNGARFEISYSGAFSPPGSSASAPGGKGGRGGGAGEGARNWWATAREVARAAAGGNRNGHEGIIFSSGASYTWQLRAAGDVMNLATMLGLPHEIAHASISRVPRSLVIRAETRKTYRAILSEPKVVFPSSAQPDAGGELGGGEEGVKGLMELLNEEEDRQRKRKSEGGEEDAGGKDGGDASREEESEGEERRRRKKRRRKNR